MYKWQEKGRKSRVLYHIEKFCFPFSYHKIGMQKSKLYISWTDITKKIFYEKLNEWWLQGSIFPIQYFLKKRNDSNNFTSSVMKTFSFFLTLTPEHLCTIKVKNDSKCKFCGRWQWILSSVYKFELNLIREKHVS